MTVTYLPPGLYGVTVRIEVGTIREEVPALAWVDEDQSATLLTGEYKESTFTVDSLFTARSLVMLDPLDPEDVRRLGRATGVPVARAREALRVLVSQKAGPSVSPDQVEAMLRQVQLDRTNSEYWSDEHRASLDGAEAWLLSLRDQLGRS